MSAPGNKLFLECFQVVTAIVPRDLAGGAHTGDWVDVRKAHAVTFLLIKDPGTASQDLKVQVRQAKDNAGDAAKDLRPRDGFIWKKQATSLAAVAAFEDAYSGVVDTAGTDLDKWTDDESGEQTVLLGIEIRPEHLDEGFTHVTIATDDTGATAGALAAALALVEARDHRSPDKMLSAIG